MPKIGQNKSIPPKENKREGWEPTSFKVLTNGGSKKSNGFLCGYLFISKEVVKDKEVWMITHTNTNLTACGMILSEDDVFKIGDFLWENFCLILRLKTDEEIKSARPDWLKAWVDECEKIQGWVDPKEYCKKNKIKMTFKKE